MVLIHATDITKVGQKQPSFFSVCLHVFVTVFVKPHGEENSTVEVKFDLFLSGLHQP